MSGLYIRQFIDRLQHFENKGGKDFICPLADAKNLHADITKLLLDLEELRNVQQAPDNEVINVELDGGSF
jgi:hypothetical protein